MEKRDNQGHPVFRAGIFVAETFAGLVDPQIVGAPGADHQGVAVAEGAVFAAGRAGHGGLLKRGGLVKDIVGADFPSHGDGVAVKTGDKGDDVFRRIITGFP